MSRNSGLPGTPPGIRRFVNYPEVGTVSQGTGAIEEEMQDHTTWKWSWKGVFVKLPKRKSDEGGGGTKSRSYNSSIYGNRTFL